jgi:hypothetical protein
MSNRLNLCPHCGEELPRVTKRKHRETGAIETVNPYGHPFPHAKLYNVRITPRLIGKQSWSPKMIDNNDPRCWPISGKPPAGVP